MLFLLKTMKHHLVQESLERDSHNQFFYVKENQEISQFLQDKFDLTQRE